MDPGIPLDHAVARNLREVITERGISHATLAAWMRVVGVDWTANRVAQTVTLRRSLTLFELAALCNVFRLPLDRFLAGDDMIVPPLAETPDGPSDRAPLSTLRDVLRTGNSTALPQEGRGWHSQRSTVSAYVVDPLESEVAERLDIDAMTVRALSHRLYGNTHISTERDRRVGDVSNLTSTSIRAKRGHAMRAMLAEMREELAKPQWAEARR